MVVFDDINIPESGHNIESPETHFFENSNNKKFCFVCNKEKEYQKAKRKKRHSEMECQRAVDRIRKIGRLEKHTITPIKT